MMTMTGAFLKARTTEIADKMLSVREVKIISRFFVFVFFFLILVTTTNLAIEMHCLQQKRWLYPS